MNYTITSIEPLTIGTQEFNSNPISLVSITCLQEEYFKTLYDSVSNKDLNIQKNGIELEKQIPIISRLISLSQGLEIDNHELMDDWSTNLVSLGNAALSDIESDYPKKTKDGDLYYRKSRARLLEKRNRGEYTDADLFFIDSKSKNIKDCLLTGDWKTALEYLNLITVEGSFTQVYKDQLKQELLAYISTNY